MPKDAEPDDAEEQRLKRIREVKALNHRFREGLKHWQPRVPNEPTTDDHLRVTRDGPGTVEIDSRE